MPLFLRLWVGPDYAVHALQIAEILVVAQFIRLTMLPYATVGYAAGQLQRMLIAPISEASVNVLFSLVAVQFIGARGVAIGTLIGAIVSVWLHFSISLRRTDCVALSRKHLAWTGILKPLAYAVPVLLVSRILIQTITAAPLQLLLCATSELILLFLLWNFNFDTGERAQLKGTFHHTIGRSGVLLRGLRPQ
jgi:O-antigen/teichoic acid export membrane protein